MTRLLAIALLLGLWGRPAVGIEVTEWATDWGFMTLEIEEDGLTYGEYGDLSSYAGEVEGWTTQGTFDGWWLEDWSEVRCSTPLYEGTDLYYWGTVSFWFYEDYFEGTWAYCDNPPGSGGIWDGELLSVSRR